MKIGAETFRRFTHLCADVVSRFRLEVEQNSEFTAGIEYNCCRYMKVNVRKLLLLTSDTQTRDPIDLILI